VLAQRNLKEEAEVAIEDYLRAHRMDKVLAGLVEEKDDVPTALPFIEEPERSEEEDIGSARLPPAFRTSLRKVARYNLGVAYDFGGEIDPERDILSPLWTDVARGIVFKESSVILGGVLRAADLQDTFDSSNLRDRIIRSAVTIGEKTSWPDTVVISARYPSLVDARNDILDFGSFSIGERGMIGRIGGIPTYLSNALDELDVLVYDKSYVMLIRQSLKIDMDDVAHPSRLKIDCLCVSNTIRGSIAAHLRRT